MNYMYRLRIWVLVRYGVDPLLIMKTIEHFVQKNNIAASCIDTAGVVDIEKFENQLLLEKVMMYRMDVHAVLQSKELPLFGKALYWLGKDIYIRFKPYNVFGGQGAQYIESRLYKRIGVQDFQCLSQYHFVYPTKNPPK